MGQMKGGRDRVGQGRESLHHNTKHTDMCISYDMPKKRTHENLLVGVLVQERDGGGRHLLVPAHHLAAHQLPLALFVAHTFNMER